jgi:uncharacterized protein
MKSSKYNYFVPTKDKDIFLLYNTLHGSVFVVDDEIQQLLTTNNPDDIEDEILEEYRREKIVIEDELDEKEMIKIRQDKSKYDSKITSITLLTTYDCNLRCVYCYEGAGEQLNDSMDEETARKVVEFIKNQTITNRSKALSLFLYGGEPLMNYKTTKSMLAELREWTDENDITLITSIVTNGTLLKQEHLDDLSTFNIQYIQITLDGPKKIHDQRRITKNKSGTYDVIIEKIKLVQECETVPNPLIRINIDSKNVDTIPQLLDDLIQEGLQKSRVDLGILKNLTPACSSLTSCLSGSELSRVLPPLWRIAFDKGFQFNLRPRQAYVFCGSLKDAYYTIDPRGDLYKCWDHVGIEEHRMASLLDESGDSLTPRYYEWMSRDALEIPECRECIFLPACGGGCAAISYAEKGTYKAPGCFKIKYLIEEQLKIYLEMKYPDRFDENRYTGKWDYAF